MPSALGLIAGNGLFPFLTARGARAEGRRVVAIAFHEEADPGLAREVDAFHTVRVAQLGKLLKLLAAERIREAVLCGQVKHTHVFRARPDLAALRLVWKLPDTRTDTILKSFAAEMGRHGVALLDSTRFVRGHLATPGPITRRKPDARIARDIEFGFRMAKSVAGLDVGQTVVVKKGSVVAVESVEGTDAAIERAAQFAGDGVVAVKVAKPKQDMRFDVPVVGERTVAVLARVKAAALVVEAGKTLFLDKDKVVAQAEAARLPIVGRAG